MSLAKYDPENGFSFGFGNNKNNTLNEDTVGLLSDEKIDVASKNLDTIVKRYQKADQSAIEFAQGVRDGSIQLKEGETYLQAYQRQLEKTSFSFTNLKQSLSNGFKSFGAGVINFLGGAAIATTSSLLIQGTVKLVDAIFTTKKEIEEEKQENQKNNFDNFKSGGIFGTLSDEYQSFYKTLFSSAGLGDIDSYYSKTYEELTEYEKQKIENAFIELEKEYRDQSSILQSQIETERI